MAFNGQWSDTNGAVNVASFDKIAAKGSLPLKYDAKAPAAKTAESEEAATATFVVKDLSAPTMAAGSSWYKTSRKRNTITKITFMDSYTPSTAVDQIWFADVDDTGSITCYLTGTEIIIAGNGSGKIKANTDSSYMFASTDHRDYFTKLTAIENMSSFLDTADVSNMHSMFSSCSGLTSLDLSNFNTANVTNMYSMFKSCKGLTSLDLSHFDISKITSMDSMFAYCSGLTSLDLSNFNTANVTDMSYMFNSCSKLTTIYAGDGWSADKVIASKNMFKNCTVLKGDISFNSSSIDKTYAKTSGGYLTYKAATRRLNLDIDSSGVVNGYTENSAA